MFTVTSKAGFSSIHLHPADTHLTVSEGFLLGQTSTERIPACVYISRRGLTVPLIHAGMAISPPSPSVLYLVRPQKVAQQYVEIFKVKDDFKPSSHLQASSRSDDAEEEPL